MSKIGLFGGTFDPIHDAHIHIAKMVLNSLSLDKIIFIPAGVTPHKHAHTNDARIRYEMVKTAIDGMDKFEASDYEVNKATPSYSVETVSYFKELYPEDELVFIVGADSLDYIDKWYNAEKLLVLCAFAVVARGGIEADIEGKIHQLNKDFGAVIYHVKGVEMKVSSSEIRKMIADGKDVSEFVSKSVLAYINKNGLYKKW